MTRAPRPGASPTKRGLSVTRAATPNASMTRWWHWSAVNSAIPISAHTVGYRSP